MNHIRLMCLALIHERAQVTPADVLFDVQELYFSETDLFAIEHDVRNLGLAHMITPSPSQVLQSGLIGHAR